MNDATADAKGKGPKPKVVRYRKPPSIKPSRPPKGEPQRIETGLMLGKDVAEKTKKVGLSVTDIRTLRQFGFQPTHISHFVDHGRALGLKDDQIGGALKAQIVMMEILRDDYSGRSTEKARKALKDANGNVSEAIIKKKYSKSLKVER